MGRLGNLNQPRRSKWLHEKRKDEKPLKPERPPVSAILYCSKLECKGTPIEVGVTTPDMWAVTTCPRCGATVMGFAEGHEQ